MTSLLTDTTRLLGLSGNENDARMIVGVVAIGAVYASGSAHWKAHKRNAVEALVQQNVSSGEEVGFRRYASFGREYCREVIVEGGQSVSELRTMRVGPQNWNSGPLVLRRAHSSFEECRHDARG